MRRLRERVDEVALDFLRIKRQDLEAYANELVKIVIKVLEKHLPGDVCEQARQEIAERLRGVTAKVR